jgi:multiple sugar transport system substrate-binding protein
MLLAGEFRMGKCSTLLRAAVGFWLAVASTGSLESLAAEKTTLRLATWTARSPGFQEWWPELIKAFEAAHPDVTVNVQQVAFADFTRTVTTQFVAGSPPDIVHVPLPTVNLAAWANAGFLAPLDQRLAGSDIRTLWPKTQAAMTWKGTTYGVLMADYGFVLFYNEALLKSAGVSVPTTPEELLGAAAAVSKSGKYGFAITSDRSPNFVRDALHFVTGLGGEWSKGSRWNWTDPKVVAALDLWRKLAREHAPKGTDNNAKRQAFYNGDVAMMIENPAIWPNVKPAAKPDVFPSLHLARVPFANVPGDTSHGLAIPANLPEGRAQLVWQFIQFAASAQWQREYARLVKAPVARPGSADLFEADPDMRVIAQAAVNSVLLISNDATGVRQNYESFAAAVAASLHGLLQSDVPTGHVMRELEKNLDAKRIAP